MIMRIALGLAITVFFSTLYWSELLSEQLIFVFTLFALILLFLPSIRILAVIPLTAIYFSCYAQLTLTGALPYALPLANDHALQKVVDGEDHSITVQISSLISDKNSGFFIAKLIELDGVQLNFHPLLEMRWYQPDIYFQDGQQQRFKVRFKPVWGRANPAGFDSQKWRYSEHVAYQATVKSYLGDVSQTRSLRAVFYEKVTATTARLEEQGIILALAFADKSLIGFEKKELLKKLGITHLFAISGLHIGLLFSFCYLILSFCCKRFFAEQYLGWASLYWVNWGALLGAFFYAYLAGFSLPTQRALLMLVVAVFLLSLKRKYFLNDLLLLVLFIILLWDPLSVLSLSLWLSFSAIAIILFIMWRFHCFIMVKKSDENRTIWQTMIAYVKILLLIQLLLTLLMMPLQLISFSAFNLSALLVNFIAVPLFSLLIIPLVLFACLLTLLADPLAFILFSFADDMIHLFLHYFTLFSKGYDHYSINAARLIIIGISLLVVMLIIHYQAATNRVVSYLFAVILICFVIGASYREKITEQDKWFVEVLDVGQGLAVLIRSQGLYLLYDTGPSYPSGFVTAERELLPYFYSQGIAQLDYLIISHSDNDHAGGFASVVDHFSTPHIFLGEPLPSSAADMSKRSVLLCAAGQQWLMGHLTINVLSPYLVTANNNNNSCVLRVSDGVHSVVLTGDIEQQQESLLVKKADHQLDSDILFAPHHGSKYSSSEPFIRGVSPQWVVFTSGFMNRWGFPAEQVKLRYKNQSVKMVNSGVSGFVRFTIEKEQIKIQTYREDLASYWYHHSFPIREENNT